ncbi:MAG: UDP-N-acetylmuramoyl-tripeptide--D-alanyl-D-alanine ligase [Alphaproteobacteria bacterium]|nr:UDP-N-acetylmuramoyl-tripeptide--D-alanyl-D-alanine ligase [Alphaproteobacteria bacterium]
MTWQFAVLLLAFAFFAVRRSLFALKFFQQNEYLNWKFFKFIFYKFQLIDKIAFACMLIAGLIASHFGFLEYIATAIFIVVGIFEKNPLRNAKKKLVLTSRAKRIFLAALLFNVSAAATLALFAPTLIAILIAVQLPPFMLIASNIFLWPIEFMMQRMYLSNAIKKLRELNPICIGITGSFGKTSTKNILQHILQSAGVRSYATARSINTLMGVVRVVREDLSPGHKYFIVEMGTDSPGGIAKLCNLINPEYGILTAVGAAHYENFKSLDNVAREKFDLVKSIAKNGGDCIINSIQVAKKYINDFAPKNSVILPMDLIRDIRINADGLRFVLNHGNNNYKIFAPVYGEHQANNITLAFCAATQLGIPTDTIIAALATLPQTPHRLEVKRANSMIIVDDGFNSNLDGFLSAIDTVRILANSNKGRAIIITPGMVELGAKHDEYHKIVGQRTNEKMDMVIVVAGGRIPTFINQIDSDKLIYVESKSEADKWLSENAKHNDTVLYENDLPDVYEEKIRI